MYGKRQAGSDSNGDIAPLACPAADRIPTANTDCAAPNTSAIQPLHAIKRSAVASAAILPSLKSYPDNPLPVPSNSNPFLNSDVDGEDAVSTSATQGGDQPDLPYFRTSSDSGVAPRVLELSRLQCKRRKAPKEYWKMIRSAKNVVANAVIAEVVGIEDLRPYVGVSVNGVDAPG